MVERFKTDAVVEELFTELNTIFLPCFYTLVCSPATKDVEAVAAVRESWCGVLSIEDLSGLFNIHSLESGSGRSGVEFGNAFSATCAQVLDDHSLPCPL